MGTGEGGRAEVVDLFPAEATEGNSALVYRLPVGEAARQARPRRLTARQVRAMARAQEHEDQWEYEGILVRAKRLREQADTLELLGHYDDAEDLRLEARNLERVARRLGAGDEFHEWLRATDRAWDDDW
jgi:hypothetical protein